MELSSIRRCFITYRECNANTNSPTLYSSLHFNQRTRMGCDTVPQLACVVQIVSIHAPAWGATQSYQVFYLTVTGFNPRTRMGCDSILSNELNIIVQIYRICE